MRIIRGYMAYDYFPIRFFLHNIYLIICVYGDNNIQYIKHKQSLQYLQTDSRIYIYIYWHVFFICSKLKLKQKIKQKYCKTRGAYYMRKHEYFGILRAKVGLRIVRGCVLYAENYGDSTFVSQYVLIIILLS